MTEHSARNRMLTTVGDVVAALLELPQDARVITVNLGEAEGEWLYHVDAPRVAADYIEDRTVNPLLRQFLRRVFASRTRNLDPHKTVIFP